MVAAMEGLHGEVVEAQRQRGELVRWKLILVAGLGAVGLGLTTSINDSPHLPLVLACIPFVCAYIDAIVVHLSLRVRVIGGFRRTLRGELGDYERFVQALDPAFWIEKTVLYASTLLADLAVAVYGLQHASRILLVADPQTGVVQGVRAVDHSSALLVASSVGAAFVVVLWYLDYRLGDQIQQKCEALCSEAATPRSTAPVPPAPPPPLAAG